MKYRAVTGLNYPDGQGGEKRVEAGETFDDADLTKKDLDALLKDGAIEKAAATRTTKPEPEGGE